MTREVISYGSREEEIVYKGELKSDSESRIAGARKDDSGKAPIYRGVLSYFPNAIRGVANVSQFGAIKYAWNGWLYVDDGHNRYSDGLLRHLGQEAEGEVLDAESGLHHDLHSAWNALARAELRIRQDNIPKA